MWNYLFQQGIKINFAHRTFKWESEAKGKAHVHVVIIGFGRKERRSKRIYEYDTISSEIHEIEVKNISPYLVEGSNIVILPQSRPICDVPPTIYGNKPADGGYLMVDTEEHEYLEKNDPAVLQYVYPMISAREYFHGKQRYCLWLKDASPAFLRNNPFLKERLLGV